VYFPLSFLVTSHVLNVTNHLTGVGGPLHQHLPANVLSTTRSLAPLARPLLALGLTLSVPAILSGAAAFWSLVWRQARPGDALTTVRWTPKVRFAATHAAAVDAAVAISAFAWWRGAAEADVWLSVAALAALWVGAGAGYLLVYAYRLPGSGPQIAGGKEKKEM
jgi:hypothetical protein